MAVPALFLAAITATGAEETSGYLRAAAALRATGVPRLGLTGGSSPRFVFFPIPALELEAGITAGYLDGFEVGLVGACLAPLARAGAWSLAAGVGLSLLAEDRIRSYDKAHPPPESGTVPGIHPAVEVSLILDPLRFRGGDGREISFLRAAIGFDFGDGAAGPAFTLHTIGFGRVWP